MHESDFKERLKEIIGDEPVAAFARRCGFSEGLIRAYLKDDKRPGMERLIRIADAAGVTVDWLATGRGIKHRRDLAELAQNNAETTAYNAPHARRWEKIIALVEGIEDEQKRAATLDELFARAQEVAELDTLRKAVAALQKKTA